MAKYYTTCNRHFKELDAEELKRMFHNKTDKYIMRSLILNEKEFLSVDYYRSLRGLWYNAIKPVLSKLDLLNKRTKGTVKKPEGNLIDWSDKLSAGVTELLREGMLTYQDLMVVDASRSKVNPFPVYFSVDRQTYGYQVTSAPYSNIILTTEKDTVYPIIQDMAQIFGCSCISGSGQNSLAAMEFLIRGMEQDRDIIILSMSDYDPSGFSIAETFGNQARDILKALHLDYIDVKTERVGIHPDQLTTEEIEQNKYTPKEGTRDPETGLTPLEKWFYETGGINGERYGLELDAFTPSRIRDIFSTCLKKYIDQSLVTDFVKKSYIRGQVQLAIREKINGIISDIEEQESENIKQLDFDVFEKAKEGQSTIPVMELCEANRNELIREKALSYFR